MSDSEINEALGGYPQLLCPFWIFIMVHPALIQMLRLVLQSRLTDCIHFCHNESNLKPFRHAIAFILSSLLLENYNEFLPISEKYDPINWVANSTTPYFSFPENYNQAASLLANDRFENGRRMGVVLSTLAEFKENLRRPSNVTSQLRIYTMGKRSIITLGYCRPEHLGMAAHVMRAPDAFVSIAAAKRIMSAHRTALMMAKTMPLQKKTQMTPISKPISPTSDFRISEQHYNLRRRDSPIIGGPRRIPTPMEAMTARKNLTRELSKLLGKQTSSTEEIELPQENTAVTTGKRYSTGRQLRSTKRLNYLQENPTQCITTPASVPAPNLGAIPKKGSACVRKRTPIKPIDTSSSSSEKSTAKSSNVSSNSPIEHYTPLTQEFFDWSIFDSDNQQSHIGTTLEFDSDNE
jgi:hypothetical protein